MNSPAVGPAWGSYQLLCKEVSSPSLEAFKQRLGNRSALGMLHRKFNSCNAEWEEWGYVIFTLFHTKSL